MNNSSANTDIDFQQAVEAQNSSFDSFLKNQEKDLKNKMQPEIRQSSNQLWLLVSVLMLSIIGLGVFTLFQKQNSEKQIAQLKNQSVAGVQETNGNVIIGAEGFSLVLKSPAPQAFKLDRRTVPFEFIPNKTASASRFVARINRDSKELVSGVEIVVSEYDNKLNLEDYNKSVVSKLGSEWTVKDTLATLPKSIKLTKYISSINPNDEIYTALTADNYYLIKIYNQTTKYADLAELSRFTDGILDTLYLN